MTFSTNSACPREQQILAALRTGATTSDMQRHLAECSTCAEAARISSALLACVDAKMNSATAQMNVQPGDARIIWLLAAERRHAEKEQKLRRIVGLVPIVALLLIVIATVIFRFVFGGSVDALLGSSGTSGRIGPVFLLAVALVVAVVMTAPTRTRSS